jgi:hypothetical protein
MRSLAVTWLVVSSCGGRATPVVAAPTTPGSADVDASAHAARRDEPVACARPWQLEAAGGDSRVVVVCGKEVQRQSLDQSSEMARALFPALDPAQERVCECTRRMHAPPFIDLVFTAKPDEGRVTAQASAEDDLDPELGPPFLACVGTVAASFAPTPFTGCSVGKASFVYPVRLELEP